MEIKIRNWKLVEIIEFVQIVSTNAEEYMDLLFAKLGLPPMYNLTMHRGESFIDWRKMPIHYKFFFDSEGEEENIKRALLLSDLRQSEYIKVFYFIENIVVKIPTSKFLEDWEGMFYSIVFHGLIISEDDKLIIEVTRDYYLHSNFLILQNKT